MSTQRALHVLSKFRWNNSATVISPLKRDVFYFRNFNEFSHCLRNMSTTTVIQRAHLQKKNAVLIPTEPPKDDLLKHAFKEYDNLKERLNDEFAKHFSLKTDLRVYEDCNVTLSDGTTHKMNCLGRISMQNPQRIVINFEDNPSAIKSAKTALQNSAICTNPQQEGVVIYIPIQNPSRELREQVAANAKTILNDYKNALNEIYCKHSDKNDKVEKKKDDQLKRRNALLTFKKEYEKYGEILMKEKREALMKEIGH